jgi:spore coat polysaccharide biosynthesis predicted glycosyltransferase SpsG
MASIESIFFEVESVEDPFDVYTISKVIKWLINFRIEKKLLDENHIDTIITDFLCMNVKRNIKVTRTNYPI